jgi:hypothetical protein
MTRFDRLIQLERRRSVQEGRVLVLDHVAGETLAEAESRQFPDGQAGDILVFTGVPRS